MCKVHISLQELQAVAPMMCKMALQLYGKMVALIWLIVLLKLIYVLKVEQHVPFFPD